MADRHPTWGTKYNNHQVDLTKLYVNSEWDPFLGDPCIVGYLRQISKFLSHCLQTTKGAVKMYPYPDLLFNCLNRTPLSSIKLVILGQDPYFNTSKNDPLLPQATGLSFSVPPGVDTPSSLNNIYKNLFKYRHIHKIPNHGDIRFWADQGCLLLNTSLTVQHGYPNSHANQWEGLTNKLIQYISQNCECTVFLLWGANASKKRGFIDETRHKVLISSHPSGLSCNKKLGSHPPFNEMDHFGKANQYLKKNGREPIIWNLADNTPKK